jgi:ABC-type Na+ efflux pump permease subunit
MSTRAVRSVLLVARREIRERLRSKGFRVAFALVLLGVVALTVVPKFINPATSSDVGVVGSPPPGFEQTLTATAAEGNDVTVTTYADTAAGEDALRSGDIDVLWDPGAGQLVVENTVDPALASQGRAAATQVRFSSSPRRRCRSGRSSRRRRTTPPATPSPSAARSRCSSPSRSSVATS